jgi:hypothetical protein
MPNPNPQNQWTSETAPREGKKMGATSFTTKVREALDKIYQGKATTAETALVESILKNAIERGKTETQKMIWNYLDGMPVAKVEQNLSIKATKEIEDMTRSILSASTDTE